MTDHLPPEFKSPDRRSPDYRSDYHSSERRPTERRAGRESARGYFLHSLFQQRLPQDRHIQVPLLARLISLRQLRRMALIAWYLLAIGLAGWLGFSYVQNVRVLESGPIPSQEMVTESGFTDPLPELQSLHDRILKAQRKNRTLIISSFGFDQSKAYEAQLKERYLELFSKTVLRMEPIAIEYWQKQLNRYSAGQKQLYAWFLLGQYRMHNDEVSNDRTSLQEYAQQTDPLWAKLFPLASQVAIGPLYLAYKTWHKKWQQAQQQADFPDQRAADYAKAMAHLLSRVHAQEADWLWSAPAVSAEAVTIADFWIDVSTQGWIELPGGLTQQGRNQAAAFLEQLLLPLNKDEASRTEKIFWKNYWEQFFAAWEQFTNEFIDQGRQLSESPGNIGAAGSVLRQDGPYWRLFTRFAEEMKGLPDAQNRPSWVRQWQILSAAWDSFILKQNRKTGGVADKLNAMARQVVHSGEELAGQRINLAVSTRDQLAQLFASYLADLAALSPVTVPREERVDQFSTFFRGLQQGETSSFYTAHTDYSKLVTLDSDGAEDTLVSRLIFAPLAFISQIALDETTSVLQQEWTATVIAPLGTGSTANQISRLFSQTDSPVPKFIAGPLAPFIEASGSGYRARKGYGMSLPFRQDFLAFLFDGTRASQNTLKSFTVDLSARPMNVNAGATSHPFASTISMQCADKEFVLENWNYTSQAQFSWSPASCGDLVLTIRFPAGISLSKHYAGPLGFPKFLDEFSNGSKTFSLDDLSGDSRPLREQKLSSITLSYVISGAPDVRSWLTSVPPQIPQIIFTQQSNLPSVAPTAEETAQQLRAWDEDTDFNFPQALPDQESSQQPEQQPDDGSMSLGRKESEHQMITALAEQSTEIFAIPHPLLRSYFKGLRPLPQQSSHTASTMQSSEKQEDWIRRQSPQSFTIQLLSQRSSHGLDDLVQKYPTLELHWFQTVSKRWHVVISGSFPSRDAAELARKSLPTEFHRDSPLIKSFASIHADLGSTGPAPQANIPQPQ